MTIAAIIILAAVVVGGTAWALCIDSARREKAAQSAYLDWCRRMQP